jgi:hypothetical protein
MRDRYLRPAIEEFAFSDHKIALVSGPRQCGKTTLARSMLKRRGYGAYYNWDQREFRGLWAKSPQQVVALPQKPGVPLVVLDEIHKARLWKRNLKGIYDTVTRPTDFFVTGSARLAVYRRGSDSLLGRYRSFRLHPFSLAELRGGHAASPDETLEALLQARSGLSRSLRETFDALLRLGPFPEPFLSANERKARLWRRERVDAVIRQDLRDLSRIVELDRVQMLAALLPERVGSLLSVQALRQDLEVSHDTARRWLVALGELYYCYEIKPYSRRVRRSLRKEGKLYLWDWSEVNDPALRFENLVAAHLLKACHYWTDTGYGTFDLCFVRNRDGREIDFLIVRDGTPWLPIEVKLRDRTPSPAFRTFLSTLRCNVALQIVNDPGCREVVNHDGADVLIVDAADVLRSLV